MDGYYKRVKALRYARQQRTRQKIRRVSDRLRLVVFRSTKHVYAQIVDDAEAQTVVSASTMSKEFKDSETQTKGIEAAKWVGKRIAEKALESGINQVVFDKGKYQYHGRVKALADAARESGLDF